MRFPIDVEAGTAIGIGQSYRGHGVSQLREWRIKGDFVSAKMILIIDRACLHGGESPRAQQGYAVTLGIDHEFHGHGNYLLRVAQKFTSHLVREGNQR